MKMPCASFHAMRFHSLLENLTSMMRKDRHVFRGSISLTLRYNRVPEQQHELLARQQCRNLRHLSVESYRTMIACMPTVLPD
jgi:hypothetical protein